MENGATISNSLNVDWVDQQFETPKKVYQIEQKYLRTEERPIIHKTFQVTLIIPCEVQIGEA